MKKILALILAILMIMTVFVGCGNDEEIVDDFEEDIISEDIEENTNPENYVRIDAMCDNNYDYYNISVINDEIKETTSGLDVAAEYKENETVAELLERCGYTDYAFPVENEGFQGWALYKMTEDGMEDYGEDILYTTQGMLEHDISGQSLCFVAMWENTDDEIYESMGYDKIK